jgi:integrase
LKEERHLSDSTVETKVKNIKRLRKKVNIWDMKAVKRFIAGSDWGNNYKTIIEYAYLDWCRFNGFNYGITKYPKETKIPYIPLEKDIDQLIAGFKNSIYAPMLQLLKESGFRPEEAFRLTPNDFDLERQICTLNKPAKHSLPRQFKMSNKLTAMITPLLIKTPSNRRIWKGKGKHIKRNYQKLRNNLAEKLGDSRLRKISLGIFRHYFGTMTYYKTKDIIYTQRVLGHKNIQNTMVYIHMINFESDEYICNVSNNIDEAIKLLEFGFEYVTDYEGKKLFRKRK